MRGEALDGVTHFGDDLIAAEDDFGAEGDFFEKLAVAADGGNAEVGAAEIDADGEVGHGGRLTEVHRERARSNMPCRSSQLREVRI